MKKLVLTSLLTVFAIGSANAANYFVGGSAGMLAAKGDHNTAWYVMPEVGYHVDSKWDLGLLAGFGYDSSTPDNYEYGVGAFARYNVAEFHGVKLLLNGMVSAEFETIDADKTETATSFALEVAPMITYDVSESLTLYANLNFLKVGARYDVKNEHIDGREHSDWAFGALADSSDVFNTGDFKIGFYYNF